MELRSPGELIVQGGPKHGARCALSEPITLLGSEPHCDIRLTSDDVAAHHCGIFASPTIAILRSFSKTLLPTVNGETVTSRALQDGDHLQIGKFHFTVRLKLAERVPELVPQEDLDVLRAQASAVAAEQVKLFESEEALERKKQALAKQEEQLSVHLEERRLQLLEMQERIRAERTDLEEERTEVEAQCAEMLADAKRSREETATELVVTKKERQRLIELRKRLKKRWRLHWKVQEEALFQREKEQAARSLQQDKEQVRLEDARKSLQDETLRYNGETELGRRRLREAWAALYRAQREWQAYRKAEGARLESESRKTEQEMALLTRAQRALADQHIRAESLRQQIVEETQGLDARAWALREQLVELENSLREKKEALAQGDKGALPPGPQQETVAEENGFELLAPAVELLSQLTEALDDQRRGLVDHWDQFLRERAAWGAEQALVLPEMEQVIREVQNREHDLDHREERIAQLEKQAQEGWEEARALHFSLEAWRAGIQQQENHWQTEREDLLATLNEQKVLMGTERIELEQLRERWQRNRRQEVEILRKELKECRGASKRYTESVEAIQTRLAELDGEQRSLCERALALDQLQLELAGQSNDSVATDKRVEKLRRQWRNLHAKSEKRLRLSLEELRAELARLSELSQSLTRRQETLMDEESKLTLMQTDFELRQAVVEHEQLRDKQEVEKLHRQSIATSERLNATEAELELLVGLMMGDRTEESKRQAA